MMPKNAGWLERPAVLGRLKRGFLYVLALLIVLDLVITKHPVFAWEALPGFFAVYGFLSCVVIIVFSNLLGRWIKRKEGYYE